MAIKIRIANLTTPQGKKLIKKVTKSGLEYSPEQKPSKPGKAKCFVIMPLAGLNHIYAIVVKAWKEAFGEDAEIFHQEDDPNKGAGELMDDKIQANIRDSAITISILSLGEKEQPLHKLIDAMDPALLDRAFPLNPNVLIELGYALRCRQEGTTQCKDVLMVTEKPQPFNFLKGVFDIGHRNFIPYEVGEAGEVALKNELTTTLKRLKEKYSL